MTTTSMIIVNAALAAVVVLGLLRLLVHGIATDRRFHHQPGDVRLMRTDEREELAA